MCHDPQATIHYISNFAILVLVPKLLKFHENFTAGLLDALILLELLSGASKRPYFFQKIRGLRPLCSYTEVLAPGALPLNPAVRRPSARHALHAFLAVKLLCSPSPSDRITAPILRQFSASGKLF